MGSYSYSSYHCDYSRHKAPLKPDQKVFVLKFPVHVNLL